MRDVASVLFTMADVKATLANRKDVFRRVVKPQPPGRANVEYDPPRYCLGEHERHLDCEWIEFKCPYDVPRLWVREAWSPDHRHVYPCPDIAYRADGYIDEPISCHCSWDLQQKGEHEGDCLVGVGFRWRPAITMPRRHARLWLDVVSIHVERLHDITPAEVLREGVRVPCNSKGSPLVRLTGKFPPTDYLPTGRGGEWSIDELLIAEYAGAWDAANHAEFPWASNPRVFRTEFTRVQW